MPDEVTMTMEDRKPIAPASVMVVDDNPGNLKLVGGMLGERGYIPRLIPEGRLALMSAQANPPDVILLDIRLADLDGYEICAALKADQRTHEVPVIFCSALDETFDKVRAFAVGGVDYITKPFDAEEALARVATHVALRRARRKLQEQNEQLQHEIARRTQAEHELQHANAELRRRIDENAGLYQAEQRQRQTAESLREVTAALTSSLDLETVLQVIFAELGRVVAYQGAAIFLADGDGLILSRAVGYGEPSISRRIPLDASDPAASVFNQRAPRLIPDTTTCADRIDWGTGETILSWMGAPLVIGATTIGVLIVDHAARDVYDTHDLRTLQAFAHQAAIAIENARLFAQVRAAAAEEERRRLARELHDSVSQALFLANLNADVLPLLWDQDPTKGRQALSDLQQFTRSALAEMRTLLIELRPTALTQTPLAELLRLLVESVSVKHRLAVEMNLEAVPLLPSDVQICLYRIAQEAFNNIVKHAQARLVTVRLAHTREPDRAPDDREGCEIVLRIADNGQGFDRAMPASGGLGLGGMAERAGSIGARLTVNSELHRGTEVVVIWRGVLRPEGSAG
jgi:signal transduction histidine kinase/FixJ family two-component response regulator